MDFEDRFYLSLPTSLKAFGAVVVVVCIVVYVLFQARHLITGPVVQLTEALPLQVATSSMTVRGTAENITSISLNGRAIFTTDDGSFEEVVILPLGYTIVTIEATDRYGATTRLEHGVVRTATR